MLDKSDYFKGFSTSPLFLLIIQSHVLEFIFFLIMCWVLYISPRNGSAHSSREVSGWSFCCSVMPEYQIFREDMKVLVVWICTEEFHDSLSLKEL